MTRVQVINGKAIGKNKNSKVKGLKLGKRDFMQFEDLAVWQRSADLACDIYKHFKASKEFGLKDQITRSALSISSNIAEGYERKTSKDYARFLSYSKGSCGELRSQIYIQLKLTKLI